MRHAVALALTMFLPAGTAAQAPATAPPPTRQGFTLGVGLGAGSGELTSEVLGVSSKAERRIDASAYVMIGGAIKPNLTLAGEVSGWRHSEGGAGASLVFASVVALVYPSATCGFFFKGGGGVARTELSALGTTVDATGSAGLLGLGYDIRVSRGFALSPYVNVLLMPNFEVAGSPGVKIGGNLLQAGLALTWQ